MNEFWLQEDKAIAESLIKRIRTDGTGTKIIAPPLTRQEIAWMTNFVWRSMLWRLVQKTGEFQ